MQFVPVLKDGTPIARILFVSLNRSWALAPVSFPHLTGKKFSSMSDFSQRASGELDHEVPVSNQCHQTHFCSNEHMGLNNDSRPSRDDRRAESP
jgi:hypothetical protein